MHFIRISIGILFMLFFATAKAYQVTDIKTFDFTIHSGDDLYWSYNLADYGFVTGRDRVIGQPILVFELRDPNDQPGMLDQDHPFVSLYIDQARTHTRASKDWTVDNGAPFFNNLGYMNLYLFVDADVWLGDVRLMFEFDRDPTVRVPEPTPVILCGLGLLFIGLRQRRFQRPVPVQL